MQVDIKGTKVNVGDLVRVHQSFKEGDKDKSQIFEGRVISIRGREPNKTFMVRKLASMKIGVEKIFPVNLPSITKVEIKKSIPARRAKLYYLRKKK